jgi:cysteine-S-conjugate beta-lyase
MAAMPYDFVSLPDRRGSSSLKWDYGRRLAGRDGLLPMWVADMDFRLPPEILRAIEARVTHGVFGYTLEPESYFQAALSWLRRRHGWEVRREWVTPSPGVMASVSSSILAFSAEGDKVVVQPPVYHPFEQRIAANRREVLRNPLILEGERYRMDLEGLERSADERTRLLILCSPHNPVGRVWEREELERLVSICARRGIVIVSDEIHHDLVMEGFRHVPLASLSEAAASISVTLTSVTKTFNLAGLGSSLAIVPSPRLRAAMARVEEALWPGVPNALAVTAAEAAWTEGEAWLEELVAFIGANHARLRQGLRELVPLARLGTLEGTYLAWIDLRELGMPDGEVTRRLREVGGVWLDEGRKFGPGGEGRQRLNLACPRAMLDDAIGRIGRSLRA